MAPPEARGQLLVTKALTVEKMGKPEQAIELLREAESAADRQRDPRLAFFAIANHSAMLCRLGRFALAEIELNKLIVLGKTISPELQRTWLCWIRGSVAAGVGRWSQAEAHLGTAARAFAAQKASWETALVSLELAVLLCRGRQLSEVHALARELGWIVQEAKLSRQALAALQLLRDAAEGSGVTREVAERALQLLQRAPKADAPEEPQGAQEAGSGRGSELSSFSPAAVSAAEPLLHGDVDGGRRSGSVAAAAARVEDAAAVDHLAGGGPEGGHPGDQAIEEAGGLGRGISACRQGG